MYSTAPGTSRELAEEITIDGIRIPVGTNLMVRFLTVLSKNQILVCTLFTPRIALIFHELPRLSMGMHQK